MNVDEVDRYPFLASDVQWIRQALAMDLPLLGICLGSQLLAKALGARVYPNRVKEIGWYPVEWTPAAADDPLLAQTGASTVFQWHGDTFDLPSGAILMARSRGVRESGVLRGDARLRVAVPHRDDRRDDRRLAQRAGQLPRTLRVGLHRPRTHPRTNAARTAPTTDIGGRGARAVRPDVPATPMRCLAAR